MTLRNENHLYRIVLVHIIIIIIIYNSIKYNKTITSGWIENLLKIAKTKKNCQNLNFSITACLTDHSRKARGQTKQHMATILRHSSNSPVVCAFWGSDECRHSAPCLSFIFNQAACLLHPTKRYQGNNFPYQVSFSNILWLDLGKPTFLAHWSIFCFQA